MNICISVRGHYYALRRGTEKCVCCSFEARWSDADLEALLRLRVRLPFRRILRNPSSRLSDVAGGRAKGGKGGGLQFERCGAVGLGDVTRAVGSPARNGTRQSDSAHASTA